MRGVRGAQSNNLDRSLSRRVKRPSTQLMTMSVSNREAQSISRDMRFAFPAAQYSALPISHDPSEIATLRCFTLP
jgi:hypothetical protein